MKKINKQKWLIGLCAPIAIVGSTIGVVGIVAGQKHKQADEADAHKATVTFSAGEGKFSKNAKTSAKVAFGKTLNDVEQPVVQAPRGKVFAGWKNDNGNIQQNRSIIRNNVNLRAVYNSKGDEYATIKFIAYVKDLDQGVEESEKKDVIKLKGNPELSVAKGHHFYMCNRPEATAVDSASRTYTFLGWKYAQDTTLYTKGTIVAENHVFSGDVVLCPYFAQAVTVTYDPKGAEVISGNTSQVGVVGDAFSKFNQPGLKKTGTGGNPQYFQGWYYDEACENNPVLYTDEINVDTTVHAKWGETIQPGSEFCLMEFVNPDTPLPEEDEWKISPCSTIIAQKNSKFSSILKPTIVDTKGYYKQREYIKDSQARWQWSLNGSDYFDIYDEDVTIQNESHLYVKPIMTQQVDNVQVNGLTSLLPGQSTTYTITIDGPSKDAGTTAWKVYDDYECQTTCTIASINETSGELVVLGTLNEAKELYVQAEFTFGGNTTYSEPYQVRVNQPYANSKHVWFQDSVAQQWRYFKLQDLCNRNLDAIPYYNVEDGLITTVNRNDQFTYDLIIGEFASLIYDDFMFGWTGFSGNVNWNNVNYIGDNFMYGCTNFTGPELFGFRNIYQIGDNFLAYSGYNQTISMTDGYYLTSIGANFLNHCENFNAEVWLPRYTGEYESNPDRTVIMDHFMNGCTSFAQEYLYIPRNIKYIGDYFMHNCDSFTGNVCCEYTNGYTDPETGTVHQPGNIDALIGTSYNFSTSNTRSAAIATGINITAVEPFGERGGEAPSLDDIAAMQSKLDQRYPSISTSDKRAVAYRNKKGDVGGRFTEEHFLTALTKLEGMETYCKGSVTELNIETTADYQEYTTGVGDVLELDVEADIGKITTLLHKSDGLTQWQCNVGGAPFMGYYNYQNNQLESIVSPSVTRVAELFGKIDQYFSSHYTFGEYTFENAPFGSFYSTPIDEETKFIFTVSDNLDDPTITAFGTLKSKGKKKATANADKTIGITLYQFDYTDPELSFTPTTIPTVTAENNVATYTTTAAIPATGNGSWVRVKLPNFGMSGEAEYWTCNVTAQTSGGVQFCPLQWNSKAVSFNDPESGFSETGVATLRGEAVDGNTLILTFWSSAEYSSSGDMYLYMQLADNAGKTDIPEGSTFTWTFSNN